MKSQEIQELGEHITRMFTAMAADLAKRESARESMREEDHDLNVALIKNIQSSQEAFFRQATRDMNRLEENINEMQRDLDSSMEMLKKTIEKIEKFEGGKGDESE